ncbi:MAG: class I SAM-dependent methyltransferase [Desulfobacterales bacterium]|nr:class I SAM-dependent methyltransferase [Desulfobacterales bacterium]
MALEAARLGPCLEIGSYCGKSTVCLGTACREAGQVLFAVDHHRGSEEQQPGQEYFDPALFDPAAGRIDTFRCFRTTMARAGLEETVVPVVCRSALAARAWADPAQPSSSSTAATPMTRCSPITAAGHRTSCPAAFSFSTTSSRTPRRAARRRTRSARLALGSGLFEEHSAVDSLRVLRKRASDPFPWNPRLPRIAIFFSNTPPGSSRAPD